MKKALSGVCLFLCIAVVAVAHGAPGDERYASPGRLAYGGGTELNFYCMGSGSPTVVFDAGWEDWSPTWSAIQPAIARHTRACTYDRAGSGFSLPGPMPRSTAEIARELHTALHDAHIPGPYLLVGHSFGGYNLRAFADLYMPEVYGAVFVDIESGDIESAKDQASENSVIKQVVVELNQCRDAVARGQPLPPIPASEDPSLANMPCSHQFFRTLPMKEWSPALNAVVLRIANGRAALYDAIASELQAMPADAKWLVRHRRSFGDRPIRVLTAQSHFDDNDKTPPALHKKHVAYEQGWARTQRRLLSLSTDSKQILVPYSDHYIQFDQPKVVIDAILGELQERRRHR
ncbi:MAG TPA: alpha/beta hydrolase [Steroidobacteraceae bacterium]|nr:alpha/beta hydrolase [Steroidobacteraceae bacterium]